MSDDNTFLGTVLYQFFARSDTAVFSAWYRQEHLSHKLELFVVNGSLGYGKEDKIKWRYGGPGFMAKSHFMPIKDDKKPADTVLMHTWLEDINGKVYDIVTSVMIEDAKPHLDKIAEGFYIEGMTKDELKDMGIHYLPCPAVKDSNGVSLASIMQNEINTLFRTNYNSFCRSIPILLNGNRKWGTIHMNPPIIEVALKGPPQLPNIPRNIIYIPADGTYSFYSENILLEVLFQKNKRDYMSLCRYGLMTDGGTIHQLMKDFLSYSEKDKMSDIIDKTMQRYFVHSSFSIYRCWYIHKANQDRLKVVYGTLSVGQTKKYAVWTDKKDNKEIITCWLEDKEGRVYDIVRKDLLDILDDKHEYINFGQGATIHGKIKKSEYSIDDKKEIIKRGLDTDGLLYESFDPEKQIDYDNIMHKEFDERFNGIYELVKIIRQKGTALWWQVEMDNGKIEIKLNNMVDLPETKPFRQERKLFDKKIKCVNEFLSYVFAFNKGDYLSKILIEAENNKRDDGRPVVLAAGPVMKLLEDFVS